MTQEYTQRFTEVHELGSGVWPDTYPIGAWNGGWSCLANHQRAFVLVSAGTLQFGSSLQVAVYEAEDSLGTGAQLLDTKYITTLTAAGGDSGSAVGIEVRTEELTPGFSYIQVRAIILGGSAEFSVMTLLGCSNYTPVATTRWAEIVD